MSNPPSLEPALATLRLLASQASGSNSDYQANRSTAANNPAAIGAPTTAVGQGNGPQPAGGFAAEMLDAIQRINRLQIDAVDKGRAFQAGDPSVTLNDLMIDVSKSSVAFEFGKQVRNRLITAYKEVMRMQV